MVGTMVVVVGADQEGANPPQHPLLPINPLQHLHRREGGMEVVGTDKFLTVTGRV